MIPYYEEDGIVIYHGEAADVLPALPKADFVLTDPPYGVEWRSNRRKVRHDHIANDGELSWVREVYGLIFSAMNDDSLCLTFYGWPDADIFVSAWKQIGFTLKSHFVWVKSNIGLGWFSRGQHEVAYLLVKGSPQKPILAISDVIYADGTGNQWHPTQKPTSFCSQVIKSLSGEGDLVLDPFMGSGTTLVAAKNLGRRAIGIEISEHYCEIAANRLSQSVLQFDEPVVATEQQGVIEF